MKRLVLVGGGHAHVEVLRRFGLAPLPGVELVLVSPNQLTPYSGMLPGLVAGHYDHAAVHIDLERAETLAGVLEHVRAAPANAGEERRFHPRQPDQHVTAILGRREHRIGAAGERRGGLAQVPRRECGTVAADDDRSR